MIRWHCRAAITAFAMLFAASAAMAQVSAARQPRLALVVGEGAYANAAAAPETTAVNDAGLIAYQLQQAGFDVTGGRDVDRTGFESLAATFFAKLGQAGPNAIAVIYLSGLGLQADGDNRFIPTDARLDKIDAIGVETISMNELLAQLQSIPGAAHIAILDLARPLPFRIAPQVAPGLAALDPQPGLLVALSQQPGYVIEEQKEGYGAFASALAEMVRVPGLSLDELFARTRLRVQEESKGGQLPWNVSGLTSDFTFFTPETAVAQPPALAALRGRPLGQLAVGDAFSLAIERDTIDGYEEFLAAYPEGPLARRARAIIAARREAFFWRRTVSRGTPEAYWTYLRHYPRGAHGEEARYRLSLLNEPIGPPATFYEEEYDIPPPPLAEVTEDLIPYDRWYALPPPPPPPIVILPAPIIEFYRLSAPPRPTTVAVLPAPAAVPLPARIIPVPVPVPIPVPGKVAPLPLAVPPKPGILAPGKQAPAAAQSPAAAGPLSGQGQFKPLPSKGAAQPAATPGTSAPQPKATGVQPLPVPVPAGPGQLPKMPAQPGVVPGAQSQPGKPPAPEARPLTPSGAAPVKPQAIEPPPVTPPAGKAVTQPSAVKPIAPPAPLAKPTPPPAPAKPVAPPTPAVRTPPPPAVVRPAPPAPAVRPAPPRPAPPPPVARPAPPPPVARPAPPPPVARPAPPPPVARPAPPPPVARPAPPPPARPAPGKPCTPQEHAQGKC